MQINISTRKKVFFLFVLVFCLVLTTVLMMPGNPLDHLPGLDNSVFLYGGQQVLLNKVPYLDFWDHKGPLIYDLNALGLLFGGGSRWGVWAIEFLFVTLTALGVYGVAESQWGFFAAIAALMFWAYAIYKVGPYDHFQDSNYTETYSLLFNVWAVYAWLRALRSTKPFRYYVLMGLLGGLSFALRPNNIGVLLSIALVEAGKAVIEKRVVDGIKRIGLIGLGGMIIIAGYAIWYFLHGALPSLIDEVFTYNMVYTHESGLLESIPAVFVTGLSLLDWIPLVGFVIVVGRIVFVAIRKQADQSYSAQATFFVFLVVGFLLEILLASLSGRILTHYFILWTPIAAWLVAALFVIILPGLMQRLDQLPGQWVLSMLLIVLIAANLSTIAKAYKILDRLVFHREQGIEATSVIIHYVTDHTSPSDTVLVWGADLWINFYSHREAPSRYVYPFPLFDDGYTSEARVMSFLNDLKKNRPALIVEPPVRQIRMTPLDLPSRGQFVSRSGLPAGMDRVYDYIDANYCLAATLNDTAVFKLKAAPVCP